MIVLVAHNYYQRYGGEDESTGKEIELLRRKGHEVIVFARHNDEIKDYGLWSKVIFFPNTIFSQSTYKQARSLLRKRRPDIAHVHNFFPLLSPSLLYALHEERVPTVVTAHDYHLVCPNGVLFTEGKICERCLGGNYLHAVYHKCYRGSRLLSGLNAANLAIHRLLGTLVTKVDLFLTPSRFARNKLIQGGFPANKVAVKPNFIMQELFQERHDGGRSAVYMGALSKHKGLLTLLEAWKQVPRDLTLTVMGDGVMMPTLKAFARSSKLTNVNFTGHIQGEKRFDILRDAMFAIVPSEWYETFCLAAVEAMALGKPVIAADVGALREVVQDGKSGLLFQMANPSDLARKALYLADHPARAAEMGQYARSYVEENWSAEANYRQLMEIYDTVIARAKSLARDGAAALQT